MKTSNDKRYRLPIYLCTVALACVISASAGTIYGNGPANGNVDAWSINLGGSISNSFTLPYLEHPYTLQGFDFVVWMLPADTMSTVDWALTSAPFGGTTYLSGTNTVVTQTSLGSNIYGFDLNLETFTLPDFLLPTGTYWFQLQNAVAPSGDPVYWDQNDGPSQAFDSVMGDLSVAGPGLGAPCTGNCTFSESFDALGHAPEPAGFVLMGTGLVSVAALLRRRNTR